jgi:hypothetical protein
VIVNPYSHANVCSHTAVPATKIGVARALEECDPPEL